MGDGAPPLENMVMSVGWKARVSDSVWRGRRVLVTGHSGFKGTWLTLWLVYLGAEVIGVSLDAPSTPSMAQAVGDSSHRAYRVDITDSAAVKAVFGQEQPDMVFHGAAQPLVGSSYRDPIETYRVNALGTANVLEAIRSVPSARVAVIITSDKCYDNQEWDYPYRETDRLGGFDPYSASKACAELIVDSYRRAYFSSQTVGVATVRAGNVIGGGDWALHRLVPDAMRALHAGKSIRLRCPDAIRPWQHVLEPLAGYLRLAEHLWRDPKGYSEAWNFGPDPAEQLRVRDVVAKLIALWGSGTVKILNEAPWHDAGLLTLDSTKSRRRLGWRPVWTAAEAFERTVEWYYRYYRAPVNSVDLREFTLSQIKDFINAPAEQLKERFH